jgi:hypothetical protein
METVREQSRSLTTRLLIVAWVTIHPAIIAFRDWSHVIWSVMFRAVLAWKLAGHIGIDRWLRAALGAPWSPGVVAQRWSPYR